MPKSDPRLIKGLVVRIRAAGTEDDWCPARVAVASDPERPLQSIALELYGFVRAGSGWIGQALPLTVDYGAETVTDLLGNEYEIEVPDIPETA